MTTQNLEIEDFQTSSNTEYSVTETATHDQTKDMENQTNNICSVCEQIINDCDEESECS